MLDNAIGFGNVQHYRYSPIKNKFCYKSAMFLLDIDTIKQTLANLKYCSYEGKSIINFQKKDFLSKVLTELSIREKIKLAIGNKITLKANDKIYLLAQLRTLGFLFNPVAYYYIFHENGTFSLIAEVTNTPWHEKHYYVLENAQRSGAYYQFIFEKKFHVSPFLSMNYSYKLKTSFSKKHLIVHMENLKDNVKIFDATLNLKLFPLTQKNINDYLVKYPLMTYRVIFLIYWQAAKIYFKGNPFYPHP